MKDDLQLCEDRRKLWCGILSVRNSILSSKSQMVSEESGHHNPEAERAMWRGPHDKSRAVQRQPSGNKHLSHLLPFHCLLILLNGQTHPEGRRRVKPSMLFMCVTFLGHRDKCIMLESASGKVTSSDRKWWWVQSSYHWVHFLASLRFLTHCVRNLENQNGRAINTKYCTWLP